MAAGAVRLQCVERDQLVDQVQLVAAPVGVPDLVVDDAEPGTVYAGETSMESALDPTGQVQARLDDVARSIGLRMNRLSSWTQTPVSTGLFPCSSSPSQAVNGLLINVFTYLPREPGP